MSRPMSPPMSPKMGAIEALAAQSAAAVRTAEKPVNGNVGTIGARHEPSSAAVKSANSSTTSQVTNGNVETIGARHEPPPTAVKSANPSATSHVGNGKPPTSPPTLNSTKTAVATKSAGKIPTASAANNFTRNGSLSSSQSSVGSSKSSVSSSLAANGRPGRGPPPPPATTRVKPRDSMGTARAVEIRKTPNSDAAVEQMRKTLETKLGITLPSERDELATALSDGVHLCTFINHLRVRAVPSVHTPLNETSPLSVAKSKRNVENFVIACRRLGLPE
uniref:Calponin-homology (CH) domain-containing protein n=1 Tax=Plectus sambesii TaxID=2011161 RepID=A0A914V1G7_9BILA